MRMNDYYKTLGVERNATPDDIKKAYRKMAAKHHPDRGGDKAEFQKIEEAYRTLSDPQQKNQYDQPNPFGGGFGGFGPGAFHQEFNFNDIFNTVFGGQQQRRQTTQYRTQIWITLEQVLAGSETHVQLGNNREIYKLNIPQGIEDGQAVRYDNLIPNAILIVEFRVHAHQQFRRKNLDLYSTQAVNVLELMVGTRIQVTTLGGQTLEVNVPAGTQPGANLRLSGCGLKTNGHTGDQYILIDAVLPDTLSDTFITAVKQELGTRDEQQS